MVYTDFGVADEFKKKLLHTEGSGKPLDLRGDWSLLKEQDFHKVIPLRLFSQDEVNTINEKYTSRFKSYFPLIPDDGVHGLYLDFTVKKIIVIDEHRNKIVYSDKQLRLFYFFIENLVFWHEVIEKYGIHAKAFCGLQIGGKSGSWEQIYEPDSQLITAIADLKSPVPAPKVWITDEPGYFRNYERYKLGTSAARCYGNMMHFYDAECLFPHRELRE